MQTCVLFSFFLFEYICSHWSLFWCISPPALPSCCFVCGWRNSRCYTRIFYSFVFVQEFTILPQDVCL